MRLTSAAFEDQGRIPARFTCDGEDLSPPLEIESTPETTRTLALIVEDPDAPRGTWDHWVVFDIVPIDTVPQAAGRLGTTGTNSYGRTRYDGPCPPSGIHRYVYQVYALDIELGLPEGATKAQVLRAMEGHILAQATLTGLYSR